MSRSAFIIPITLIIFEQRPSGHGITDIRIFLVHELRFGELLFSVIDVIKDEKDACLPHPKRFALYF